MNKINSKNDPVKKCPVCQIILIPGENVYQKFFDKKIYRCKDCCHNNRSYNTSKTSSIGKNCRNCNIILSEDNTSKSFLDHNFKQCRGCYNDERSKFLTKLRKQIIDMLGNTCKCCGETNINLLSIDHINGGGQIDRNSFKKWGKYLKNIINMSDEERNKIYQCLCYNCNYSHGFWGVCPHKLEFINEVPDNLKDIILQKHNFSKDKEENKRIRLQLRRISYLQNKLELLQAYGGECVSCKENHPLFLTIDHINNNGNFEKEKSSFYSNLKSLGYPGKGTQLQLLCHNCNAKKEYIDNRQNHTEIITTTKDVYIKQDYKISNEVINNLYTVARLICVNIPKILKPRKSKKEKALQENVELIENNPIKD